MSDGSDATSPPGTGLQPADIGAFYERTATAAYSLARHILGEDGAAAAACEAAYVDLWAAPGGGPGADLERALLRRVRDRALQAAGNRPFSAGARSGDADPAYRMAAEVRTQFEQLAPATRRAVELASFGGLDVQGIAELLDVPAPAVRTMLREALLGLAVTFAERKHAT